MSLQIDEYEIADYKEAFTNAKQPFSTVLLHHSAAKIVDHVSIYKKAVHMLTDQASYVVSGGLGGLGRFICSWMVKNGAKNITAVSRSGAGTLEARDGARFFRFLHLILVDRQRAWDRSQGSYNVSNAFLNALAESRRSLDLPGVSVALGAMSKPSAISF